MQGFLISELIMKNVLGWYLPEFDTHFEPHLRKAKATGQPCEYQYEHRQRALNFCQRWRCAIDVGAHIGLWSRPLSARFTRLIAFEPMAEFRDFLRLNVPSAEIYGEALGDLESTVQMALPPDNSGMAHIVANSEESGNTPLRTLDSFGFDEVDFVKIDCEGYEYPIVIGARETIERCKPVIVIEQKPHQYFSDQWHQYSAIDYLTQSCGYKIGDRVIDDWIMVPT